MTIPAYLLSSLGCQQQSCGNRDCPEAVKQRPDTKRWYITMGHPGFNSISNNGGGYATRQRALSAFRRLLRPTKAPESALSYLFERG